MKFDDPVYVRAQRVLEVGCGWGELAERIAREVGCDVVAVDLSPRMVELASVRGVDARVAELGAPLVATKVNAVFLAKKAE